MKKNEKLLFVLVIQVSDSTVFMKTKRVVWELQMNNVIMQFKVASSYKIQSILNIYI